MSKNSGKTSEQLVLERRLRPIYEAIDSGSPEKAIKECDKVLKKHPLLYSAKGLKALSLVRMERIHDAVPLISELEKAILEKSVVLDDNALQALCHCLKEASLPDRIPPIYESLVGQFPKNESYLTHLFMSYARLREFQKQQKVSVTLYRDFPKPSYYMWTITSVYMQALSNPELGTKMFWPLAEKMAKKIMEIHPPTPEGVDLYIAVLEGAGKPVEALQVLEGDLGRLHQRPKLQTFRKGINLMIASGNMRLASDRLMNMLIREPDEWIHWEQLFDCTFKVVSESGDPLLEEVVKFTCTRVQSSTEPIRAQLIAQMELLARLMDRNIDAPTSLGNHHDLITAYVRQFHTKPCCYIDIRKFLPLLTSDDRTALVNYLIDLANTVNEQYKAVATILMERVRRAYGLHDNLTPQEARELAGEMLSIMKVHCILDQVNASGLTLMAVHLLWDIYLKHKDQTAFMEILMILEHGRYNYPGDSTTRLLLMRMYSYIGCVHIVERLQVELDIKYVQKDSMTYYLLPLQEQFGSFHRSMYHSTTLSAYFDLTDREVSECIVHAFKNGAFTKVPSLVHLRERCVQSITSLYGDVSNRLLSGTFGIKDLATAVNMLNGDPETMVFDNLVDNRDLTVIANLDSEDTQAKIDELKETTFKEMVDFTKLKQLLCKYVASVYIADTTPEEMTKKTTDLKTHLDYCMANYCANRERLPNRHLQAPTEIRLGSFVHSGVVQLTMKIMENAVQLITLRNTLERDTIKMEDAEMYLKQALDLLPKKDDLLNILTFIIPMDMDTSSKPFFVHDFLYQCQLCAFSVALGGLSLRILENLVKKMYDLSSSIAALSALNLKEKGTGSSKGKKKGKGKHEEVYAPLFTDLRETLRNSWRIFTGFLNELTIALGNQNTASILYPTISEDNWPNAGAYRVLTELDGVVREGITRAYLRGIEDILFSCSGQNGAYWIL